MALENRNTPFEEGLAEELFEALARTSLDGMLVVGDDAQVVHRNRRFDEMWGIPDDILKTEDDHKMIDFAIGLLKYPHQFVAKIEHLYRHPTEESRDQLELKDGRFFDRYSSPLHGKDGRSFGRVWYFRDVSDAKFAERRFISAVLSAQDAERKRLARELHDNTGSALTSVMLGLRGLCDEDSSKSGQERLSQVLHTIEDVIQNVDAIAKGLHPGVLDELGLVAALDQYARNFSIIHDVPVDFEDGGVDRELAPEASLALYRIVQEAMNNAAKHSSATVVSVLVSQQGREVWAVVEDNGKGMPTPWGPGPTDEAGLGLRGMRERAELLGGVLEIESEEGRGTTVVAKVPAG